MNAFDIENGIAKLLNESVNLVKSLDVDDFDIALERLSSAFVRAARELRFKCQPLDEVPEHLLTDAIYEAFTLVPAEDREGFEGKALIHTTAEVSPEGVTPCTNWTIHYRAERGWTGIRPVDQAKAN